MPLQQTSGNATADAFGGGVAVAPNYIEDVFSTYLYTGNGSTQTITNGIDLAGKGGLVWAKQRNAAGPHQLIDTVRGADYALNTNNSSAQGTGWSSYFGFASNGYTLTSDAGYNTSGQTYASWTFRKQPKFFDVVTYTGTGANRTIAHNIGGAVGCMIVKRTDQAGNWQVYHNSLTSAAYSIQLNLTDARASAPTIWNSTAPTSSVFSVGTDATVNASGATYVAYLFAHNAGGFGLTGTDNVISCGSYTGNGAAVGPTVTLGYEPQWLLIKRTSTDGAEWVLYDNMRGLPVGSGDAALYPNASYAEYANGNDVAPTATGFYLTNGNGTSNLNGATYIYIAIRRGPMKVPTDGTKVFKPTTATYPNPVTIGFPTDLAMMSIRAGNASNTLLGDRLRGGEYLVTSSTAAAGATAIFDFDLQNNIIQGFTSYSAVLWAFQRAPSFFDEVCYTGTDATQSLSHNLGVIPDLIFSKSRSSAYDWGGLRRNSAGNVAYGMSLNSSLALQYGATYPFSASSIGLTSTKFDPNTLESSAGSYRGGNNIGTTYVAYLFATCPGVSKVGSYTGNGTTQAIACGFAGGARFVLIKRTDAAGDWYSYDTARGMTVLTDPYLLLNSTAAETATLGSVTSTTGGFTVNAAILAAINTNAASYIYLSIS